MKNIVFIHVIVIIICKVSTGFSQDTINLMSGKQIKAKVVEIDFDKNGYILYDIKKNDKIKSKFIEKEEVYSISYYNNKTEIVYKIDSSKGFILNQNQMYNYVIGEQVAWKNYKTPKLILVGGVFCGISGPFLGVYYGLLIPAAYSAAISFVKPKFKIDNTKKSNESNVEYYNFGYNSVAKSKNIKRTIIAGLSGILASTLIITAMQVNSIDFKK